MKPTKTERKRKKLEAWEKKERAGGKGEKNQRSSSMIFYLADRTTKGWSNFFILYMIGFILYVPYVCTISSVEVITDIVSSVET